MRVTKLSDFQRSGSEMLDFWKLKKCNKSVKNYFQMKFKGADLIYQPRGVGKCNKMGGITDSTKRYGFWKKSLTNRPGVFYSTPVAAVSKKRRGQVTIHEIARIDGRRGFQTGRNVFQIGGNTFFYQKKIR
jgi:hypothetical protein